MDCDQPFIRSYYVRNISLDSQWYYSYIDTMAYDQFLADRIRIRLGDLRNVEEKAMMGGLAFMVNGKMCVGVIADEMMCRLDPEFYPEALKRKGAREMDFTGRPMKGYVMVNLSGIKSEKDFDFWIQQCLDFNPKAKASRKKK